MMREDVLRARLLDLLGELAEILQDHPERARRKLGRAAAKLRTRLANIGNAEA